MKTLTVIAAVSLVALFPVVSQASNYTWDNPIDHSTTTTYVGKWCANSSSESCDENYVLVCYYDYDSSSWLSAKISIYLYDHLVMCMGDNDDAVVGYVSTVIQQCTTGNWITRYTSTSHHLQIDGGAGTDNIWGSDMNDVILGGDDGDGIAGRDGNDEIGGGDATLVECDYDYGTDIGDLIYGGPGVDQIYGGSGGDYIYGGNGNDIIDGGPGDDYINGNYGTDYMMGGDDDDHLYGGESGDILEGGKGDDFIDERTYQDEYGGSWYANSNDSADEIYGDDNWCSYSGTGHGIDTIYGYYGGDYICTNGGTSNTVYGQNDNDEIWGGTGNDTLDGGAGDDYMVGWTGVDYVNGGGGAADDECYCGSETVDPWGHETGDSATGCDTEDDSCDSWS